MLVGHSPDICFAICSDSMAAHNKRSHVAVSTVAESSADPNNDIKKVKRRVSLATFDKWKRQFDDQYDTLRWLQCDKDATDHTVTLLWCEVCRKYSDRIRTMRNFSTAWVNGSANQRNSNIVDHAKSEQHAAAMACMRADTGESVAEEKVVFVVENSALFATFPFMDAGEMERMKKKLHICYVMAREGIPFSKYAALHNLQEHHGVDLGPLYKSNNDAHVFTQYIAKSQQLMFQNIFADKHFFSFILHHSTSEGSSGDAVVFIQCLIKNDLAKEISCYCRYLNVANLKDTHSSVVTYLQVSLGQLGVNIFSRDNVLNATNRAVLVGGSSDKTDDKDDQGVKAEMQSTFPWLFWSRCFSHQLELACKDSFTSSLHGEINDLLISLYSLYNKSPQKMHQLTPIVEDLKEVFHIPDTGDPMPVHNQGAHWINYKRRALQRIIDRFGVYCAHVYSLTEDPTLSAADQIKLKIFHQRWTQGKILISCAMYIDVLKAPSLLSLSLRENETDVISGIKYIHKATHTLQSLRKIDAQEWPTVMTLLATMTEKGNSKSYQGVSLTDFSSSTVSECGVMALADLNALDNKLREWLSWSDAKLLDAILSFLDTRCWGTVGVKTSNAVSIATVPVNGDCENGKATAKKMPDYDKRVTEIKAAVAYIVATFREPLEAKGADLCSINDELEEMFSFCANYVDVLAEDYKKIWYKLFTAHDAQKWHNVLLISELLFSLPFANSKVERAMSTLNRIRAERHDIISDTMLDELMQINIEGPSTDCFTADHAIYLWWTNRPQQIGSNPEGVHHGSKGNTEFSSSDQNDKPNEPMLITDEPNSK